MEGFLQYLKDTRGELRHVAWPTQTQTIVYTILVALLSVGVSLYLGLFPVQLWRSGSSGAAAIGSNHASTCRADDPRQRASVGSGYSES